MLDEPDICPPDEDGKEGVNESVQMEGFAYVSDTMDILTGEISKKSNPQPIMSKDIKERLLFIDLMEGFDIGQVLGEQPFHLDF